ncbi:MAG TPA: ABC transporter ATP-binding protein, partial [Anaerolineae bacterium]|nr:ABC transporter ATP-binding protein [Anaerolineae bacterium]
MTGQQTQSASQHLLDIRKLETQFHTEDGVVHAVNGISYTMDEGDTLGVVGESGCGKSVHALSIMRLIPDPPGKITGGEIFFQGQDLLHLTEDEMRRVRGAEIAMIFQDPMTSLNPVLTIGYQIMEALKLHQGMDNKTARERAGELLVLVGIPEAQQRLDDYPHQFSGGMRQRVMIAMALSCNPSLLIADEPTTALDVTIQAQIV